MDFTYVYYEVDTNVLDPTAVFLLEIIAPEDDGKFIVIKRVGQYDLNVSGNGNSIDGVPSLAITSDYGSITVLWHAAVNEWRVISKV